LDGQNGVQTYFFIIKFNEIYIYVGIHKDHCIFKGIAKKKSILSLVEYIWHTLESNLPLQKIGFKNYLHLEKSTWNLLLQCKI
jgi:hypothetical protein